MKLFNRCNHSWVHKYVVGIEYRYCPKCGKLQRRAVGFFGNLTWKTKKGEGKQFILEHVFGETIKEAER